MKRIDFIFIGSSKNKSFSELESDYHGKLSRYVDSSIKILKDSSESDVVIKTKKESADILKNLQPSDLLVLCDERGKSFDSVNFSKQIASWQVQSQRVVFVIGGAFGVDEDLRKRANSVLRLSEFVMPHELARVVLLEQVYRAFTIQRGEKYHHV